MGLFITRGEQRSAATNVVLAQDLLPHLDHQHKKWIITHIVQQFILQFKQTVEQVLLNFDQQYRVTQLFVVAWACDFLEIYPRLNLGTIGRRWVTIRSMNSIANVYALIGHVNERDIATAVQRILNITHVKIDWPGDNVRIDFLEWYGGADATPVRGGDVFATVAVPEWTAQLGGVARVLLPTRQTYEVNIPAGVSNSAHLRLRGLGRPGQAGGAPGDAIVTIEIEPSDKASTAQRAARQEQQREDQKRQRKAAEEGGERHRYEEQERERQKRWHEERDREREATERERRQRHEEQKQRRQAHSPGVSAAQALEILGLSQGADDEAINAAYRRLMKRVHPDLGGSIFFAKQLNAAREALLKQAKA